MWNQLNTMKLVPKAERGSSGSLNAFSLSLSSLSYTPPRSPPAPGRLTLLVASICEIGSNLHPLPQKRNSKGVTERRKRAEEGTREKVLEAEKRMG